MALEPDSARLASPERIALEGAIRQAGGAAALARALNLHRTAVHQWQRVPADHVAAVAQITGMEPAQLRPDLAAVFGVAPSPSPAPAPGAVAA